MATTTEIKVPAIVTLTNTNAAGGKKVGFVPYKENFTCYINATDILKLECGTAGQVLYYLGQATPNLTVSQTVKP